MSGQSNRGKAGPSVSNGERKIGETTGEFCVPVKDGEQTADMLWIDVRILVSNQCVYLVAENGKLTVEFSDITNLSGQTECTQSLTALSHYMRVEFNDNVVIIAPDDYDTFREQFYTAALDTKSIICKHPFVKGGVVQNAAWKKTRVSLHSEGLTATLADGTQLDIELDTVIRSAIEQQTINGTERDVISVSYVTEDTIVETHLTGGRRACMYSHSFFREGEQCNQIDIEFTKTEEEIILALHSGVSSFEIPDFVGADIETVEKAFDRLIEHNVIDEVRTRREVSLNPSGRGIATGTDTDR